MDKQKYLFFILLTSFSLFCLYFYRGVFYEKSSLKTEIKKEENTFLSGAKKLDYTLTKTGFVLNEYKKDENVSFSSGILSFDKKSFTGTFVKLEKVNIYKNEKNYFLNSNSFSGILKNSLSETTDITFLSGFTKMKLLGKEYSFNDKNINLSDLYNLDLFLSDKKFFVFSFENYSEAKDRKKIFDDYLKKTELIKQKYWDNPTKQNELLQELNNSYNIEIDKLK